MALLSTRILRSIYFFKCSQQRPLLSLSRTLSYYYYDPYRSNNVHMTSVLLTRTLHTSCCHNNGNVSETKKENEPSLKKSTVNETETETQKLTLFQRFKKMYKDYWYVLIPVHVVTSVAWFGGFYYLARSGVDVVALLENLGVSEKIVNPLRGSSAGYVALAYALYKVATPARYAVTIGGTTISINYLTAWGWIKPVPSKQELKDMYERRKEKLNTKRDAFRQKLRQHRAELKRKMNLPRKPKK